MIKIYGSPKSSAGRCYWLLQELGLPYEAQKVDMRAREHKGEKYLSLNPNGKVPCLADGDFVIWESMAINQYLAEKYESPLLGATPEERGLIAQWSYWAILELQRPFVDLLIQKVFVPEERRNLALIEKSEQAIPPLLDILNDHLESRKYIVTDDFTLADLNLASVVNIASSVGFNISSFTHVARWLRQCHDRPSFQKLEALE